MQSTVKTTPKLSQAVNQAIIIILFTHKQVYNIKNS